MFVFGWLPDVGMSLSFFGSQRLIKVIKSKVNKNRKEH